MDHFNPIPPEFKALIEAIKTEGRAYRKEEQREDRAKRCREWITIGLLALTFGAISLQVHEMIKVYGPIRDQAAAQERAALAATKQSESAEKAAEAATEQSKNAQLALTLGQRAWVGPVNIMFSAEPAMGKPIEITTQYQNSGHEPALGFIDFFRPTAVLTSEEERGIEPPNIQQFMSACRATTQWSGGSVVYPGSTIYTLSTKIPATIVDSAVISGKKIVIVQGCFLYRTFDTAKFSYFCFYYRQGVTKIQNLNICASGHDAD